MSGDPARIQNVATSVDYLVFWFSGVVVYKLEWMYTSLWGCLCASQHLHSLLDFAFRIMCGCSLSFKCYLRNAFKTFGHLFYCKTVLTWRNSICTWPTAPKWGWQCTFKRAFMCRFMLSSTGSKALQSRQATSTLDQMARETFRCISNWYLQFLIEQVDQIHSGEVWSQGVKHPGTVILWSAGKCCPLELLPVWEPEEKQEEILPAAM